MVGRSQSDNTRHVTLVMSAGKKLRSLPTLGRRRLLARRRVCPMKFRKN